MTDAINKIPSPSEGNAVYFIKTTRTVNGVATDIFVPTEYLADMPTYVATVPGITAGANKNIATLVNKIGSTKTIRIVRIYATPFMTAAIAGLQITLEVHGIQATTPGAGSIIPIRNYDTDDGALPAQIEARGGQGVAITGSPLANWKLASGVVNNEETSPRGGQSDIFKKDGSCLILRPNEGIIVVQTALAGAGAFNLHIVFIAD